jgi:anthranilate/para-aminobenzoate synthase component I
VEPVVREVPLAPNIEALSRALRGVPGAVVLRSDPRAALHASDVRASFLACEPVERSADWVPREMAPAPRWNGLPAAPRWVGVVPYDTTRALERSAWTRSPDTRAPAFFATPVWQRYDAVLRIDHATGRVAIEADDAAAADRLRRRFERASQGPEVHSAFDARALPPAEPDVRHVERVREVLRRIAAGDVYQVNLARAIELEVRAGDPLDVFLTLFCAAPASYGLFADFGSTIVCAASPELALEVRGDRMRTAPIKGTRPRGRDAAADASLARELDADPKERAELTMATDLHRNDLGRVAALGSVRVLGQPRVIGGRTVWSRVAEVVACRAPGVTLDAVVRAVLPCGSVTGAPKVRAMEIIAELEPVRRGAYTGAFGYLSRENELVLAMGIRTLEIADRRWGRYGTGGGIVADSDPLTELEETRWKSSQLAALLGGAEQCRKVVRGYAHSLAEGTRE